MLRAAVFEKLWDEGLRSVSLQREVQCKGPAAGVCAVFKDQQDRWLVEGSIAGLQGGEG